MYIKIRNLEEIVNLEKVNFVFTKDTDYGSKFMIVFVFNKDCYVEWKYEEEKDRDKAYKKILALLEAKEI